MFSKNYRQYTSDEHWFQRQPLPKRCDPVRSVFYVRYAVSYQDLEEIMAERGVQVDHATLNRWVVKYSPSIAKTAQQKKQPTAGSWRMDKTYIKVKGKWMYLYRTVDKHGKTPDFILSKRGIRPRQIVFQTYNWNEWRSRKNCDRQKWSQPSRPTVH